MKILALEQETSDLPPGAFAPHLEAEAEQAWELYRRGVIRELHFHRDRHTAVLVLECADTDEARRHLDTLPLVRHGLITFELLPLTPYDGFARLFARRPESLEEQA